jgi:hypothetical protein
MNTNLASHPAVRLGRWLMAARQKRRMVKRVFAAQVYLTPSKYSEVEAGVVRWIGAVQEAAIVTVLDFVEVETERFQTLLKKARQAAALTFSHLFTREQLEPMRLRHHDHRQPTESDKELILAAVFTPIL